MEKSTKIRGRSVGGMEDETKDQEGSETHRSQGHTPTEL